MAQDRRSAPLAVSPMAQLAAVLGALAAPLVLADGAGADGLRGVGLSRSAIALLASNESAVTSGAPAALGASASACSPSRRAVLLVRRPELVLLLVLAAAPFRLPLDFGGEHASYVAIARGGRDRPAAAPVRRARRGGARSRPTASSAVTSARRSRASSRGPLAAFASLASLSFLWSTAERRRRRTCSSYFLLPVRAARRGRRARSRSPRGCRARSRSSPSRSPSSSRSSAWSRRRRSG